MSGRGPVSGSGCTSCCSPACGRRVRSSGREPWSMPAMCRRKGGLRDGPEPGRQSQKRLQAPPPGRRDRDPARVGAHGRQPSRQHAADPARRPRSAGARHGRPAAPKARPRHRRPRLRLPKSSPRAPSARHQSRDRPTPNRARLRPRPLPLGCRAHLRLAAPIQAAARPLRPPRRHPRSLPRHRLLPRLLPPTQERVIVKGALRHV